MTEELPGERRHWWAEPYQIKMVEPLRMSTRAEREAALTDLDGTITNPTGTGAMSGDFDGDGVADIDESVVVDIAAWADLRERVGQRARCRQGAQSHAGLRNHESVSHFDDRVAADIAHGVWRRKRLGTRPIGPVEDRNTW